MARSQANLLMRRGAGSAARLRHGCERRMTDDNLPSDADFPNDEAEISADALAAAPQWNSADLLQGRREAYIVHGGEIYRLRCTRNGKLILQK